MASCCGRRNCAAWLLAEGVGAAQPVPGQQAPGLCGVPLAGRNVYSQEPDDTAWGWGGSVRHPGWGLRKLCPTHELAWWATGDDSACNCHASGQPSLVQATPVADARQRRFIASWIRELHLCPPVHVLHNSTYTSAAGHDGQLEGQGITACHRPRHVSCLSMSLTSTA